MTLWFAALLGLVQGLTEFLPISSTAHLRVLPALLGQPDPGAATTAVIQLGTLGAVLAYFARDLLGMCQGLVRDRRSPEARLAFYVVLGTIPIGLLGVALKPFIEGAARSLWVVAGALVGVGVIMAVVDRLARRDRALAALNWIDAVIIGAAQACALVPGVSRSGATLIGALLCGLRRPDAARFSFLLSIPAVGAAALFEVKDAVHVLGRDALPALGVGIGVAAITGYLCIAWLLRYLATRTLDVFSAYRVLLGGVLVALLAANVLQPL
jgi:undecaprenyl-diphosphatase